MQKPVLLLIDSDDTLRSVLTEQFVLYDAFEIQQVGNVLEGITLVTTTQIDLIILNTDIPDMDGSEVCKQLRKTGFNRPIIMLAGQEDDMDRVLDLNVGVNDYVIKPFKFATLLARVRTHLQSYKLSNAAVYQFGSYEFHPSSKMLICGERTIYLTEKETSILKYLFYHDGKPVSRDALLSEVWGYRPNISTHTLETHIYRLRQKMQNHGFDPSLLITDTGGYRINI